MKTTEIIKIIFDLICLTGYIILYVGLIYLFITDSLGIFSLHELVFICFLLLSLRIGFLKDE